jgi:hypothetical protein
LHLVVFTPATLFGMIYVVKDGLSLDRLRRIGERQVEEVDREAEQADSQNRESKSAAVLQG